MTPVSVTDHGRLTAMLFGLFGVGVTQPLLDLYGRNPEVFIANRSSSSQIVLFALVVAAIPTLIVAVPAGLMRHVVPSKRDVVDRIALAVAGFFAASALLSNVLPDTNVVIVLAVLAAVGLAWVAVQVEGVRTWLTVLGALPVVVLVSFFAFSESGDLLGADDAVVVEGVEVGSTTPVVLLVMDELPVMSLLTEDAEVNTALFPNFGRLAADSTWFRNAASNSIATADSVPIVVSGRLNEGATPTSADNPDTLFTLLGGDYQLVVNETVTMLCPDALCAEEVQAAQAAEVALQRVGATAVETPAPIDQTDGSLRALLDDARIVYGHVAMPPVVKDRLPSIDGRWGDFVDSDDGSGESLETVASNELPPAPTTGRPGWMNKMLRAIDAVENSRDDTFYYTHIVAPHIPWNTTPSGAVYTRPEQTSTLVEGVEGGYWIDDPAYAVQGMQRHLAQLGAVDRLLGLYIDELQRTGVWDDAVVVVTADHGGSFEPGAHRRWVMGDNADELYRVPLFVRAPGLTDGAVRDEPAYALDIVPTIVDALDIEVAWELEGLSLLGDLPGTREHRFEHFTGDRVSLDMDLAALALEVGENYEQIPDTNSWQGVAAVGPYRDVVGQTLAELGVAVAPSMVASVDGFDDVVEVDPSSGVVPSILTGRVTVPEGWNGSDLLLAVNGTIRGSAFAVRDSGSTFAFSGYVPEAAFAPGANAIDVIAVDPDGMLWSSTGGEVASTTLRTTDGAELDIVRRGQRLIQIDSATFIDGQLRIKGFGADTGAKEPPEAILLFYGDELVYEAPPNLERSDVPVWHDSENLRMSGFLVDLPEDEVPDELQRITAVAVWGSQGVLTYATLVR